jgi:hypothetical protein
MKVKATVKSKELKDGKLLVTFELEDGQTVVVAFDPDAPIQAGDILSMQTPSDSATPTSDIQFPYSSRSKGYKN